MLIFNNAANAIATPEIPDVPNGHWANVEIYSVVNDSVMNLYSDRTFRPTNSISRADFNSSLLKALEYQVFYED